ncbi:dUTP diphosphatase [Falsihalocynthiibacter sp. BN13B15]|uniref:dUTP diphosphatase n=1 Tax=Falsihalocynthiibacter sp. BN13B15 TaxID=3240871 RepID=UPI003510718E
MEQTIISLKFVDGADQSIALPSYETSGSAGADVRANFPAEQRDGLVLCPNQRALIPAGFSMELPEEFEVQIRPRSGLALKHGITLLNTPGTIDSDYRGPLGLIVVNFGDTDYLISHGDRIAQMVVAPVIQASFSLTETLSKTKRGAGGFGSTGKRDG